MNFFKKLASDSVKLDTFFGMGWPDQPFKVDVCDGPVDSG